MHVNLLPPTFVWRRLFRKRIRQWGCAFGLLAVAFLGGNVQLFGQWWIDVREFQSMHADSEPIRQLQADRIELDKQSIALKQKIKQLQTAVSPDRTTSLLGIIVSGVNAANGAVQIQEMQVSVTAKSKEVIVPVRDTQPKSNPKPLVSEENTSPEYQYQLTLRGIAVESESISSFMNSLQSSTVFPKVELRSTQERVVSERSLQEFQLECLGNE